MNADLTLLDSAKKMNGEALIKIFDLYSRALYNYALRLCGDPVLADNVVGDVFSKLLEQFSAGHGPNANLRAYLYEMAYHIIVDDARYARRETALEIIDSFRSDNYSAALSYEKRVTVERVMTAIRKHLTRDQRHVVILRFIEGFSLRETADIIGKEVGNVKVIQSRAVAMLRKALDLEYAVI